MKIPSRERALSRRKCGREGRRLVMQNIGMRPHCCERFEGEMNLLIMHKLTKDPPPCPQDLWTSEFPSKLTNLYKCWSFMQFQTGAVCLWKPTHFHVSIWMGMVVGGRLPIIEKQGCLRETFMLFLFLDWHPIVNQHQFFATRNVPALLVVSETTGTARKPEHTKTVIEITWYCHCLMLDNVVSDATV